MHNLFPSQPGKLIAGVVQFKQGSDASSSAAKIAGYVREAKNQGCLLVVLPKDGLYSPPKAAKVEIDSAVEIVKASAAEN